MTTQIKGLAHRIGELDRKCAKLKADNIELKRGITREYLMTLHPVLRFLLVKMFGVRL